MPGEVLFFSRFTPDENGHGGSRRAAQLAAALAPLDPTLVALQDRSTGPGATRLDGFRARIDLWSGRDGIRLWSRGSRAQVLDSHRAARHWRGTLLTPSVRLVVVEDAIRFAPMVRAAVAKGIPVVTAPQNLEGLVVQQVAPGGQGALLLREVELLRSCALTVAISREETFVLTNFGIATHYFPYHPAAATVESRRRVRRERERSAKSGVLCLGTAGNSPTRVGMKRAVEEWRRFGLASTLGVLTVAGYGTEALRTLAGEGVEVAGAVDEATQDAMLVRARAAVVWQKRGAGALTRIPELLIAGVPVIASTHAARSWHGLPGIVELDSLAGLASLRLPSPAEIAEPPAPDAAPLVEVIRGVMEH